jgi:arylsulfatase A-like enzyme
MADVMPTLCDAMQQPVPDGVQGNSLWRLLHGQPHEKSDFESAYVGVGLGGLFYDASDHAALSDAEAPNNHHLWDSLNKVTQSGCEKMVRKGDWKLVYDMMGYGQLYHLPSDPGEVDNLFGQPATLTVQAELMRELTRWLMRSESAVTQDSLRQKD